MFRGTTDVAQCAALPKRDGAIASFYSADPPRMVLCLGLTRHTTLDDVRPFAPSASGLDQAAFDDLKRRLEQEGYAMP